MTTPNDETPIEDQLTRELDQATSGPFTVFYRDPARNHAQAAPNLTALVRSLQPKVWDVEDDRNRALRLVVKKAFESLPEGGPQGSNIGWREVGELLCGFRSEELPPRADRKPYTYSDFLTEVFRRCGPEVLSLSERQRRDRVPTALRKHLAVALLQLTPEDFAGPNEEAAQAKRLTEEATQPRPASNKTTEPGDTPLKERRTKKRHALIALATAGALLITAGLSWQFSMGNDESNAKGEETLRVDPSPKASSGNPQKSATPSKVIASVIDLPTGDDLNVQYGFPGFPSGLLESYEAAFQEEDVESLKELLGRPRLAAAPADPALIRLIDSKGYFLSGMSINLILTSSKGNPVDILRIRPVNIKHQKIPVGAAFLLPSQGGGEVRQMAFDMDSDSPIARHPAGAEGPEGTPFFRSSRITIKGDDETGEAIAADFITVKGAYVFQVAVEYRVNGTEYHQLVPAVDGSPGEFRIAANLCPLAGLKPRLGNKDLENLSKLRYKHLRGVDKQNVEDGYSLIPVNPKIHTVGVNGC
ncbi:hypothetical protein [Streptomyces sp. SID9124]|uniref:hypothetical protein n=1 Tax=Streptomyces sp. SID9124 TaxID=2706108 RepID=UPI0013DFFA26|nr:hypothetical protein [Streptomyces sp. SID9124]NED10596.1 hypothetical protein [Streptomyces sp. SID9124]